MGTPCRKAGGFSFLFFGGGGSGLGGVRWAVGKIGDDKFEAGGITKRVGWGISAWSALGTITLVLCVLYLSEYSLSKISWARFRTIPAVRRKWKKMKVEIVASKSSLRHKIKNSKKMETAPNANMIR